MRMGVNTGEVVTGGPSAAASVVTGDAVNVAARLEQAAPPGEILLGELTYRLVRDTVAAGPVEPVSAKGKAEPVLAYRLVSIGPAATAPARRPGLFVGREDELAALGRLFEQAVCERAGTTALARLLETALEGLRTQVAAWPGAPPFIHLPIDVFAARRGDTAEFAITDHFPRRGQRAGESLGEVVWSGLSWGH